MTLTPERRVAPALLELRSNGTEARLVGYASRFNAPYPVGGFTETIAPGAFTSTLSARPDVRLLINHEGQPLARTKSGTLRLTQDSLGLKVESTLDATDPDVQRLVPKMRRGDLDQMSFAFRVSPGGDDWNTDYTVRTVRAVDLDGGDVSVVTYPASPTTAVSLEMLSARRAASQGRPGTGQNRLASYADVLRAQEAHARERPTRTLTEAMRIARDLRRWR